MHLSLLILAFIIMQISGVSRTPKYQKITIRSIGSGAKPNQAGNTTTSPKKEQNEVKSKAEQAPAIENATQKPAEMPKKEVKAPPKKVEKKKAPTQEKKTAKTIKKEVGKEETSRNSKNASLVEEALSSISQEVERANRDTMVAQAIASLQAESVQSSGDESYLTYVEIVGSMLKERWFYPNLGRNEKLRTTIRIFVDGSGKILNYRIEHSSGREDFDAAALRSVEQYTSFTKPPNNKPVDFVVNFNLLEE